MNQKFRNMLICYLVIFLLFQVGVLCIPAQYTGHPLSLDPEIDHCIQESVTTNATLQSYKEILAVINLPHRPLREIAKKKLADETNIAHNLFLVCAWRKYQYLHQNDIVYDSIEMALKEALIREVGSSGPSINLSNIEAKRIIDLCKKVDGLAPGLRITRTQNCILKEIQHFSNF